MDKIKALTKIDELLKTGEELLKNKEYYNVNSNFESTRVLIMSPVASGYRVNDAIFKQWQEDIRMFLSYEKFSTSYSEFTKKRNNVTNADITEAYITILSSLKKCIIEGLVELDETPIECDNEEGIKTGCIFIGHGHSKLWNEVARFLRDDLKINNVNYFEKDSHVGRSIADALRDFRKETNFAIIVMTAEDETAQKTIRTRQNVIHEIGFFQGKLGFEKVAILKQNGVESFSNIDGIQYIPFSGNNITQTFYELEKMLKREKII